MRITHRARLALLLAAALPLMPGAANAAAATISSMVHVRSGPGASYGVVAQLEAGNAVDVTKCQGGFCLVTFGTSSGWVSVNFLTRDSVGKPPAVAAATPAKPAITGSKPLPVITAALPPAKPATGSLPVIRPAPSVAAKPASPASATAIVAAARPATGTHASSPLPPGSFPPAYDGSASIYVDPGDDQAPPRYAEVPSGDAGADFDAPDDGPDDADAGPDVPRPKVDVPDVASADPAEDGADGFSIPVPSRGQFFASDGDYPGRWGHFGRFGLRHRGPGLGGGIASAGQACFFAGGDFGERGFCLHEGQTVGDLGDWGDGPLSLRNPAGLKVTVCSTAAYRDCRIYDDSAPLVFPGDAGIASISVAAPGY